MNIKFGRSLKQCPGTLVVHGCLIYQQIMSICLENLPCLKRWGIPPSPTTESNSQCERRLRVVSDEFRVGFVGMIFVVLGRHVTRIRARSPQKNNQPETFCFSFPSKKHVVNLHSSKHANMNTVALPGHLERHSYLSLPPRCDVQHVFTCIPYVLQATIAGIGLCMACLLPGSCVPYQMHIDFIGLP